jgi:hypothetical protein
MENERWLPIRGHEHYEVSDAGRVRSKDRRVHNYIKRGKVLKPSPRKKGERVVCYVVNLGRDNMRRVHRLVLEAFVGPAPEGDEGCHNDGNPANNALSNLRWDSHPANMADQIAHGTKVNPPILRGEDHPQTKLTSADVSFIRRQRLKRGDRGRLAARFGVSNTTITRIIDRKVWAHV